MKVGHFSDASASSPDLRGGGKEFRTLLVGDESAPDNYRMVVVRQDGGVYTPRHKHNFDQLRMCLSGRVNYGKDNWILPGQIAYFPEGTSYGPEESDEPRFGLTIQFGGSSGSGYLSERQAKQGTDELKQVGVFEKGVFRRTDAGAGERRNQDGFEAVWEHVNGRKLDYPKPRYNLPLLMQPENFAWRQVPGADGLALKHLGSFGENRLEIALLRLEAGREATLPARAGLQIAFVVDGAGSIDGNPLAQYSAFELDRDCGGALAATSALELLVVGLPIFAPGAAASDRRTRTLEPALG